MLISLFLLILIPNLSAAPIPDLALTCQLTPDHTKDTAHAEVQFTPPPKHHFNIQAPMKINKGSDPKTTADHRWQLQSKSKNLIHYSSKTESIDLNESLQILVYLCDDAKTYCVQKTQTFTLSSISNHTLTHASKNSLPSPSPSVKPQSQKIDHHGFIDGSNPAAFQHAVTTSIKTNRPLLIDFFGIWCPPCNFLNESVFPSAAFKKAAKNYILVKFDAHQESSFPLKSYFKVAGYPTLIIAKPDPENSGNFIELDRVVGALQPHDFVQRLIRTSNQLANSTAEAIPLIDQTRNKIELFYNQSEYKKLEALLDASIKNPELKKHIPEFEFNQFYVKFKLNPAAATDFWSTPNHNDYSLTQFSTPDLIRMHEYTLDQILQKKSELNGLKSRAIHIQAELKNRIPPKQNYISQHETSIADLASLKIDLGKALTDESIIKAGQTEGIAANLKLLKSAKNKNSRAIHLELGALYRLDGQFKKSNELYQRFIRLYPNEFTFYLGASKLKVDEKNYSQAVEMAKKAVQYSYGDNQIRSVIQLANSLNLNRQKDQAVQTLRDFLKQHPLLPDDTQVRTNRYLREAEQLLQKFQAPASAG
jgi:thiol-disulfide isomerase/thioredoxin